MRWQPLFTEIRARKLALARLDPRGGMPVLPPAGASPASIDAVERQIRRPLPPSYRELLRQHDGVPGLYQGAALLGTRPLARATFVDVARISIDPEHGDALVPFGIDAHAETIFAWDTSREGARGELEIVVWMNEIGERVPSFAGLLEMVLEMLGADLADQKRPVARSALPMLERDRDPKRLPFAAA